MSVQGPELSKTYLLKPILVPLIIWSKCQSHSLGYENMENEGKGNCREFDASACIINNKA
jgi:hypothetical protein